MMKGCFESKRTKLYIVSSFEKRAEEWGEKEGILFGINAQQAQNVAEALSSLPVCEKGDFENLSCDTVSSGKKKRKNKKTPRSVFMKECYNRPEHKELMKGGMSNPTFQQVGVNCRAEWEKKKP